MDKLKDKEKSKKVSEKGILARLLKSNGNTDAAAFAYDLFFFTLGFLFSRCHLIFGAYPLGIALLSLLPHSVLPALGGSVIGALTLGGDGLILAAIYLSAVILRIILSTDGIFFEEANLTRMSVGVICGFAAAMARIFLRGLSAATLLYGGAMVLLPPLAAFAMSGLFGTPITLESVLSATENPFTMKNKTERECFDTVFFEISSLLLLFFIGLSLSALEIFGISAAFIFAGSATLLAAKKFGATRAAAVGFVSSLGSAGIYSVAFALSGLGAGAFFSLGTLYAMTVGLGAAALWGYYVAGIPGLLSVLPEGIIASALVSPFLKTVKQAEVKESAPDPKRLAEEMLGTTALAYQNKYAKNLNSLEISLSLLSGVIGEYSESRRRPSPDDYRALVVETAEGHCKNCTGRKFCMIENIRPCLNNVDAITEKLCLGHSISPEDVNGETEFCQKAEAVAESINENIAKMQESSFKLKDADSTAEEYALISKLINEARCHDEDERAVNSSLTSALTEAIEKGGFGDGVIRAFGTRRKHIILVGEDETGDKISAQRLHREIERAAGVRLDAPEYYRRDKMALMECDIARAFTVEYASASTPGDESEVSGDTVSFFESGDDIFFALISDGMGRGETAKDTSAFVSKFLSRALGFGATEETVLSMLNYVIRGRGEECSSTVDLFELDLLSGDATFIKSGAAPSFVKRGDSLFRIKSQTAPIGLMKSIDSERIRVSVQSDDFIVMLSDGIIQTTEEAAWLIELIAESRARSAKELATEIMTAAKVQAPSHDDMSVAVIKIIGF